MKKKTMRLWLDTLERSLWTGIQSGIAVFTVDGATASVNLPTRWTFTCAGVAAGVAFLKCMAATRLGNTGTASSLPEHLTP